MSDLTPGAQLVIRELPADPGLNGKECVCLNVGRGNVTVRLPTGREMLVPSECLQLVAAPGMLPEGTRVVLVGLAKAPTLNFRQGSVAMGNAPEGRLLIDLGSGDLKALKHENLVVLDPTAILDTAAQLGKYSRGDLVKIRNFIDPGMNGLQAIVLEKDPHDSSRLLVALRETGKMMALRQEKMALSGGQATTQDLEQIRPALKEVFFLELRKLLWGLPTEQVRIFDILAPSPASRANPFSGEAKVMGAWAAFRGAFPTDQEPLMRSVLREKVDIFLVSCGNSGEETVTLTAGGRALNRSEGIPEPPTKRRRVEADSGKQGKDEVARALFAALQLRAPDGNFIAMSLLGSDPKVAMLRKDPRFRKFRLTELLKEYPSIFELLPENPPGTGLQVRLHDNAAAALPQRTAGMSAPTGGGDVLPDPEQLRLPDKIENPATMEDKLQAFRIEMIHALFRREGRAEPGQLGQDPGVRQTRRFFPNKSLVDVVRVFLDNFTVVTDPSDQRTYVQLDSMSVEDKTCISDLKQKWWR